VKPLSEQGSFQLLVDRGQSIGNSPGSDGRGRLHVNVSNTSPIPVSLGGVSHFLESSGTITPGVKQLLLTDTIPPNTSRSIRRVVVVCRFEGIWELMFGTSLVASGMTGASAPNSAFDWPNGRPFTGPGSLELFFTSRAGASPMARVDAYLIASDFT
jgi:hypothetical protein